MTTAQPSLFRKSDHLYSDSWGSVQTLHIITVTNVGNGLSEIKAAIQMILNEIDEATTPQYFSAYDCTGRYSTGRFERIYRMYSRYDGGVLQYIYVEYGSLDI